MNPIEFSLIVGFVVILLVYYKGATAFKAHSKYKQLVDEINASDREINDLLRFIVSHSIQPLFLVRSLSGFFYKEKSKKTLNKFNKEEQALLMRYTCETIKNYLTYAPHWIIVISIFMTFVGFFAILFYSLDKLKRGLLLPIELNLLRFNLH